MHVEGRIVKLEKLQGGRIFYLQNGIKAYAIFDDIDAEVKDALEKIEKGDFVNFHGVFNDISKTLSIQKAKILIKPIRKLPDSIDMDHENKYRHREVAFILDPSQKEVFIRRHIIKGRIRKFMNNLGFIEVDTPYLCPYPEIAPVRPFFVGNAQNVSKAYLRITNTEYMRRLLVGGFEKIYQIGVCFRDESPNFKSFVEFTQVTFGIAFEDYTYLMKLLEDIIFDIAENVMKTCEIRYGEHRISLHVPFKKLSFRETVLKFAGFDVEDYKDPVSLRNKLTKIGLTPPRSSFTGYLSMHILLDHLMNEFIAPKLIQPTFIYQYPYPLGGPAKEVEEGSWYKQRAELFIGGMEIANISTPQTDPLKLRHWYEETLRQKIEGNLIGQVIDEDYLTSIEYGLPPCATGAMGFDRLMMLMTNKKDIKDTIFFPYLQTGEKHNRSLFRDGGSGN